jgi:hypothetical protein
MRGPKSLGQVTIHECNIRAAKYKQYTWGVTEVTTYRTCMAEYGQQE